MGRFGFGVDSEYAGVSERCGTGVGVGWIFRPDCANVNAKNKRIDMAAVNRRIVSNV